jgi:predicted dinucleotide-binding enzyme
MKVTIIGTGKMAKGISARLLAGGHTVELHARDISRGEALKNELDSSKLTIHRIGSDVQDVVIPAVHYGEQFESVIEAYGDAFNGKVIIDITNPVNFNTFQLLRRQEKQALK